MKKFQHHPDGWIIIESGKTRYMDSMDNFITDVQALKLPMYPGLPGEVGGSLYEPEIKRHTAFTKDSQHAPVHDSKMLDRYIASVDSFVELFKVRKKKEFEALQAKMKADGEARLKELKSKQKGE